MPPRLQAASGGTMLKTSSFFVITLEISTNLLQQFQLNKHFSNHIFNLTPVTDWLGPQGVAPSSPTSFLMSHNWMKLLQVNWSVGPVTLVGDAKRVSNASLEFGYLMTVDIGSHPWTVDGGWTVDVTYSAHLLKHVRIFLNETTKYNILSEEQVHLKRKVNWIRIIDNRVSDIMVNPLSAMVQPLENFWFMQITQRLTEYLWRLVSVRDMPKQTLRDQSLGHRHWMWPCG